MDAFGGEGDKGGRELGEGGLRVRFLPPRKPRSQRTTRSQSIPPGGKKRGR